MSTGTAAAARPAREQLQRHLLCLRTQWYGKLHFSHSTLILLLTNSNRHTPSFCTNKKQEVPPTSTTHRGAQKLLDRRVQTTKSLADVSSNNTFLRRCARQDKSPLLLPRPQDRFGHPETLCPPQDSTPVCISRPYRGQGKTLFLRDCAPFFKAYSLLRAPCLQGRDQRSAAPGCLSGPSCLCGRRCWLYPCWQRCPAETSALSAAAEADA